MNLLDRYIFKSVLFTCAAAVGMFAFVLMLGNVVKDLLEYVLTGQISPATFVRLVLLLIPFVVSFALPLGMLTGVLLTLGRLSADSEITAMRTAGLSLTRIARPVVLLGILGLVSGLYVNFQSMPRARVQYHREFAEALRANPLSFVVPKTFIRRFSGVVIYVGEKQGTVLHDFWLWKLDRDGRVTQLVRAESGTFVYDDPADELILTLTNAQAEERDEKNPESFSGDHRFASFDKYGPERLPLDRIFPREPDRQRLPWKTYQELMQKQSELAAETVPPEKAKKHALDEMEVRLAVQDKINTALAIFSFALIGVPLGIKVSRRETSANLGVAVLLALGYYMMTVMVGWLDGHPEYRPDLLLWVPNVLMLLLGARLFMRIDSR